MPTWLASIALAADDPFRALAREQRAARRVSCYESVMGWLTRWVCLVSRVFPLDEKLEEMNASGIVLPV